MDKKILVGAAVVGQSGGPSSVINCSAYGIIKTALENPNITMVYGAHHGIKGVLDDRLMIMDVEDPEELRYMLQTPSSVLGSCRYKLADPDEDDTDCRRILEIFRKYNVRYFFYNGGNDSMDTCNKISKYMKRVGYECRVIGVPKTIDNDLMGTDHCPGFPSAAKYIATAVMEISRDCRVYDTGMVAIIECMGRHAGWLAASSVLASLKGDGPDLIYLPERDFDMNQFITDVKRVYEEKGDCIVVVSEGIHYAGGTFVSAMKISDFDGFGHTELGGVANRLAEVVKGSMDAKVRPIELSLLQRCAAHCASATDVRESYMCGEVAVHAAVDGVTDKMIGFHCSRDETGYRCKPALYPLSEVANTEKKVPDAWINEAGNYVTGEFVDYCLPLIQGEAEIIKEDGLPRFSWMKRVYAR